MANVLMIISIPILLIVVSKAILKGVYGWQRKEYLYYRMRDFLESKEGRNFWWDRSYWIKTLFLVIAGCLLVLLKSGDQIEESLLTLAFIFIILDIFDLLYSLFRKTFRYPKFTKKAIIISIFTFALIALPSFCFVYTNNKMDQLEGWFIFFISIWILTAADLIFTGLGVALFSPIDIVAKKKLYRKAENYRKTLKNLKVIAISGSYGKTTTKEFLYQILKTEYRVEKTEKNQNSDVAVARKILNLKPKTEIFLCEIGTYRVGLGSKICQMAQPNATIITGLDEQHFNLFGSKENIIKAESESLGFLSKDEPAYINWDNKMCHKIEIPKNIKVTKYGLENDQIDTKPAKIDISYPLTSFKLDETFLESNIYTKGDLQNLLVSLEVAKDLDIKLENTKKILKNLKKPEGTLDISKEKWGIQIDDSRNINPSAVKNSLNLIDIFDNYKKIVVLDEIPELGSESEKIHKKIAWLLIDKKPDLIVLEGKSFAHITYSELIKKGFKKENIMTSSQNESVLKNIKNTMTQNERNVILFEGYASRKYLGKIRK